MYKNITNAYIVINVAGYVIHILANYTNRWLAIVSLCPVKNMNITVHVSINQFLSPSVTSVLNIAYENHQLAMLLVWLKQYLLENQRQCLLTHAYIYIYIYTHIYIIQFCTKVAN